MSRETPFILPSELQEVPLDSEEEYDKYIKKIPKDRMYPNMILPFALHIACKEGNLERLEFLLSRNKDNCSLTERKLSYLNVNGKFVFGDSPLHIAAANSQLEIVKFLLGYMKSTKEGYTLNIIGESPLHSAYRRLYDLEKELKVWKFSYRDKFLRETIEKQKEIISLLISSGISANMKGIFTKTPEECYRNPYHNFPDSFFEKGSLNNLFWKFQTVQKYRTFRTSLDLR